MSLRTYYLDNNATTTIDPLVRATMEHVWNLGPVNAASAHSLGEAGRRVLAQARQELAALLNTEASAIVFTSGGTEANHLILREMLRPGGAFTRLVVSEVEHSSIRAAAEAMEQAGKDVVWLPVNERGLVDPIRLSGSILPGSTLVCIQWANNETGVVQPVNELEEVCRRAGAWLHVDAVQAVGKVPVDLNTVPVDSLALSAHKFHGPTGVGALALRRGRKIAPLLPAGDQERGIRPGTHNLAAIAGMGRAAALAAERMGRTDNRVEGVRDRFEWLLVEAGIVERIHGRAAVRLPNTANLSFREIEGDALVARLDMLGVITSQSSACTAMRPEPSYVLRAMGVSEHEAFRSLRFSFSWDTAIHVADEAAALAVQAHRALARFLHLSAVT